VRFEQLESRTLMTVSLAPIVGNDAGGLFEVPAGKVLYVPLTGSDPGHTVAYSASSSNPDVHVAVLDGNPTLKLDVSGTRADGLAFSGSLSIELFGDLAPDTVQVISGLANLGAYDGKQFYRIIQDFVIQGGLQFPSSPQFADEFSALLTFNSPGLLGMANPGNPDMNTSEFFITDIDQPLDTLPQHLNFRHTIFGQLTSGFDIYQDIMRAKGISPNSSTPSPAVIIEHATVIAGGDQSAVLQITAANDFMGSSTISVTAASSDGSTDVEAFGINVAQQLPTNHHPIVIDPVTDKTTAINTPISFQVSAQKAPNVASVFSVTGASSFRATPQNVTVQVTPGANDSATVTLTPATGFEGKIELLLHADDAATNLHDVQAFSLTVGEAFVTINAVTDPINDANRNQTSVSGTGSFGATVSVVVTDGFHSTFPVTTTVGAGGFWSIGGINVSALNDGIVTYIATLTDSEQNICTVSRLALKDTVVPTVDIANATNPVTIENVAVTAINGVAENGTTIRLVVTDGTHSTTAQATVAAGGDWSFNNVDLSELSDGTITYQVTAMDAAGNSAVDTFAATKTVLSVTSITNPINRGTVNAVSIVGKGGAGTEIEIEIHAASGPAIVVTTTVDSQGNWARHNLNLSQLADGVIHFKITATDEDDNSVTLNYTTTKDTVLPAAEITTATNPITRSNRSNASVNGIGEVGVTVMVHITDGTHSIVRSTTVGASGVWAITGINLTSLDDGPIVYAMTATDIALNSVHDTLHAIKDTVGPALTVSAFTNPVNSSNFAKASVSGTGQPGTAVFVQVTDGAHSTSIRIAVVDSKGRWSIEGIDVSALNDGVITYRFTATDPVGNQARLTRSAIKSQADGSLSGFVYVDSNKNKTLDGLANSVGGIAGALPDFGLKGVIVTLHGVDAFGVPVPSRTTTTDKNGRYQFDKLVPGTYTIREAQPSGFKSTASNVGNLGGLAHANVISRIVVTAGSHGAQYNFGEYGLASKQGSITANNNSIASGATASPVVKSIIKQDPDPTDAAKVRYVVTFNKDVTGVNKSDFSVISTGITGASIASVTGSGKTYTVTVNTGFFDGTLAIAVRDNDSIRDSAGNRLGGNRARNGDFVAAAYAIQKSVAEQLLSVTGITNSSQGKYVMKGTQTAVGRDEFFRELAWS
jgi:cyclophilin family peptidyl-prolyl cis-trans isomerase